MVTFSSPWESYFYILIVTGTHVVIHKSIGTAISVNKCHIVIQWPGHYSAGQTACIY